VRRDSYGRAMGSPTFWRFSVVYADKLCPQCGGPGLSVQWIGRSRPPEHERRRVARPEFERRRCSICGFRKVDELLDLGHRSVRASSKTA
jgi:hypothetical protein